MKVKPQVGSNVYRRKYVRSRTTVQSPNLPQELPRPSLDSQSPSSKETGPLKRQISRHNTQLITPPPKSVKSIQRTCTNSPAIDDFQEEETRKKTFTFEITPQQDSVIRARESLSSIRSEAKLFYNSSRKLLNDNTRNRRSSINSDDIRESASFFRNDLYSDTLTELTNTIKEIKEKIEVYEKINSEQRIEGYSLQIAVGTLERKFNDVLTIDQEPVKTGCSSGCNII